ncbi:putative endonuclease containing a URI domain [Desulfitobacterium dichloroeliminans LMG P-21439]|uniref:Putative endonuclease containing a URI domain n=1 Tax=Desulfitobacterium dichloroeliminans (strain LMG P-21439 / DCA1) TaxID=871963 RepID=L0F8Q8_DESDL|nr:GIY-YIG nuclease family protein [Desulfitobacterium dichloroeliminans]AGA69572.1 putative endonuclease containing a URI domain [Desulfitobacterium dichloroeliminans LMG P-21439]
MYWVYILLCAGKTLYTGITPHLERRIKEHNEGKGAKYTRGRRPVILKQAWVVENRSQALRLEAFIKRFSRQEKEAMIASPELLLQLAKEKDYEFGIGVLNS